MRAKTIENQPPKDLDIRGLDILQSARLNKATAFTEVECAELGLRGLLPPAVSTQGMQEERALANIRRKAYDIERYIFLLAQQSRNERLFYRLLVDHIEELMPIVYTPTVGQACKEFSHIFRQPRGLFITANDRGRVREIVDNWPERDVRVIVVTDGERILGLGDLGVNGMGIPIGKLALYTACAGIQPHQCLPVTLDVGTNNETLREDPLYLGLRQARVGGDAYLELVDEFVTTVQEVYPQALIQFEDFLTPNAYKLLKIYRDRVLCFNDDIQGTAAVILAGVYASIRISGHEFKDLRILFLGAGSAATGIADLLCTALQEAGLSEDEARHKLWFVDQSGLLISSRYDLAPHNIPYAHDHPATDFIGAIEAIKPNILIGATGSPGAFTEQAIRTMASIDNRPTIFALSNPTSRAECTAEQAYQWTDGRGFFASGSPFDPVTYQERHYRPGQGNNAYVFPGIGLGAIACQASKISDEMFLVAANVLAGLVREYDLEEGALYPPLADIRNVSLEIAVAVAEKAWEQNLAQASRPDNLKTMIKELMYDPSY